MHHNDRRSVPECQENRDRSASSVRSCSDRNVGGDGNHPPGFRQCQKSPIVYSNPSASGECRLMRGHSRSEWHRRGRESVREKEAKMICTRNILAGAMLALFALPVGALAKGGVTLLYDFTGAGGALPSGTLIMDSGVTLYGTATYGGKKGCDQKQTHSCGAIFMLAPDGSETTLHLFSGGNDGALPTGSLVRDSSGNLFGATGQGGSGNCGSHGCGAIFELTSAGKEKVLYAFTSGSDGQGPVGGVISDGAGNLYGTTTSGGGGARCGDRGASGCGIVFKVTPNGKETVLHAFAGGSDGAYPAAALIMDGSGNLYGTTTAGGSTANCGLGPNGCGTVFKIAANGTESVLHVFAGGKDGAYPVAALVVDGAGDLFGETGTGGGTGSCGISALPKKSGCGTVFKIAANGNESVLYAFKGQKNNDGAYPAAGLITDGAGNLYGVAAGGGGPDKCAGPLGSKAGCGVVFKIKE